MRKNIDSGGKLKGSLAPFFVSVPVEFSLSKITVVPGLCTWTRSRRLDERHVVSFSLVKGTVLPD
jgi:hypothetical protein